MNYGENIVIITNLWYNITNMQEVNQVEKKEREQQRVLAEKVAILSDSDIAEVRTAVEKIVLEGKNAENQSEEVVGTSGDEE